MGMANKSFWLLLLFLVSSLIAMGLANKSNSKLYYSLKPLMNLLLLLFLKCALWPIMLGFQTNIIFINDLVKDCLSKVKHRFFLWFLWFIMGGLPNIFLFVHIISVILIIILGENLLDPEKKSYFIPVFLLHSPFLLSCFF